VVVVGVVVVVEEGVVVVVEEDTPSHGPYGVVVAVEEEGVVVVEMMRLCGALWTSPAIDNRSRGCSMSAPVAAPWPPQAWSDWQVAACAQI
jgi:hypothetical protein